MFVSRSEKGTVTAVVYVHRTNYRRRQRRDRAYSATLCLPFPEHVRFSGICRAKHDATHVCRRATRRPPGFSGAPVTVEC